MIAILCEAVVYRRAVNVSGRPIERVGEEGWSPGSDDRIPSTHLRLLAGCTRRTGCLRDRPGSHATACASARPSRWSCRLRGRVRARRDGGRSRGRLRACTAGRVWRWSCTLSHADPNRSARASLVQSARTSRHRSTQRATSGARVCQQPHDSSSLGRIDCAASCSIRLGEFHSLVEPAHGELTLSLSHPRPDHHRTQRRNQVSTALERREIHTDSLTFAGEDKATSSGPTSQPCVSPPSLLARIPLTSALSLTGQRPRVLPRAQSQRASRAMAKGQGLDVVQQGLEGCGGRGARAEGGAEADQGG